MSRLTVRLSHASVQTRYLESLSSNSHEHDLELCTTFVPSNLFFLENLGFEWIITKVEEGSFQLTIWCLKIIPIYFRHKLG